MSMERMLCIYFMPRYLCLSDPTMGDALYDSESMWRYAAIELVEGATPDDSRILRFPHLIDRYGTGLKIRRESTIRGTLSSGALRCR